MEYRRGIERLPHHQWEWQRLWHFNETCAGYPTRDFISRTDRPPSSELCSDCTRVD